MAYFPFDPMRASDLCIGFHRVGWPGPCCVKGRTQDWMYCSELPIACDLREITLYSSMSARGGKTASWQWFHLTFNPHTR